MLVFVNLTLRGLTAALDGVHGVGGQVGAGMRRITPRGVAQIGRAFLRAYPERPVVRLRVRPGEAYVAPTENMLHDGSTSEACAPDWNYNLLGRIHLDPRQ